MNNLAKKTNKRVWCVLVKGLRLKAETTVGTETTRRVSDRSKLLMGPKRPVIDVWGVRIERETIRARNVLLWLGLLGSNLTGKKTPVNRVS